MFLGFLGNHDPPIRTKRNCLLPMVDSKGWAVGVVGLWHPRHISHGTGKLMACEVSTWWLIPRIVSGLLHPSDWSGWTLQKSHVNHCGYNPLVSTLVPWHNIDAEKSSVLARLRLIWIRIWREARFPGLRLGPVTVPKVEVSVIAGSQVNINGLVFTGKS